MRRVTETSSFEKPRTCLCVCHHLQGQAVLPSVRPKKTCVRASATTTTATETTDGHHEGQQTERERQ